MAQKIKNLPAMQETWVLRSGRFPREGKDNPPQHPCLEKFMDREPGRLQSVGQQRAGHEGMTDTFTFTWYWGGMLKRGETACQIWGTSCPTLTTVL